LNKSKSELTIRTFPCDSTAYFQEVVFPRYKNLFAVRAGSKIPEVLKLFMLLAVGGEPTKPALRDELLAIAEVEETHRSYLQRLAALLRDATPDSEGDPLQQAEQLSKNGDFDQAFSLLLPNLDKVSFNYSLIEETKRLARVAKSPDTGYTRLTRDTLNPSIASTDTVMSAASFSTIGGSRQSDTKPYCPHCGHANLISGDV
jgi:hypothetical protein